MVGPLLASVLLTQTFNCNIRSHRQPSDCPTQEVTFHSRGLRLAATLYKPSESAPVIVIVAGSNAAGRGDSYLQTMARVFSANGFAALIYDKPGVGASEGTYVEMPNLRERGQDVQAAVAALYSVKGFRPMKVGLWGISQGGWVLPLAANLDRRISFLISASGPAVSPMEQDIFARSSDLKREGFTEAQIKIISDFSRRNNAYVKSGVGFEKLKAEEDAYASEAWFARAKDKIVPPLVPAKYLNHPRLAMFKNDNILLYQPLPTLKHVKQPILACFGTEDRIVNAPESAKLLENLKRSSGLNVKIVFFKGANHSMMLGGGAFAPGYFDSILDWATRQAR